MHSPSLIFYAGNIAHTVSTLFHTFKITVGARHDGIYLQFQHSGDGSRARRRHHGAGVTSVWEPPDMGPGTKFQSSEKFLRLSGVFPCSYRTAFNSVLLRWRARVEISSLLVFYHYRLGVHVSSDSEQCWGYLG